MQLRRSRRSSRIQVKEERIDAPKRVKVKEEEEKKDDEFDYEKVSTHSVNIKREQVNNDTDDDDEEDDDDLPTSSYIFQGVQYDTYQDMVNAKRKRNQELLKSTGLLDSSHSLKMEMSSSSNKRKAASTNGIKRKKVVESIRNLPRRKSSRLAGAPSDGLYVKEERAGRFSIAGGNGGVVAEPEEQKEVEPKYYNGRINDGSDITIAQAVGNCALKWVHDNSVQDVTDFVRNTLKPLSDNCDDVKPDDSPISSSKTSVAATKRSPTSVISNDVVRRRTSSCSGNGIDSLSKNLKQQIDNLSVDDDNMVAKVTPDRIYSVAVHPSPDNLIVAAGDKTGYVGLWNVNHSTSNSSSTASASSSDNDGVHLFKLHTGSINHLEFANNGNALLSSSYDGTVRWFDFQKETFEEIFATYDDDSYYCEELGFGLHHGYHDWTQYCVLDHRFGGGSQSASPCFFVSTSGGMIYHVDRRIQPKITLKLHASRKKINTVSLHPNGYSMATGGLDNTLRLWDLRKFGNTTTVGKKSKKSSSLEDDHIYNSTLSDKDVVATFQYSKSINSAFFSPSGNKLVLTSMENKIDIFENIHLLGEEDGKKKSSKLKNPIRMQPSKRTYHNNNTGRWLSTFMARWHPVHEIFCVGSMNKPRGIDIFSGYTNDDQYDHLLRCVSGDAVTAVASRCCFHPSANQLILVGGNSSGRVTIMK